MMTLLKNLMNLKYLVKSEKGQGMVEYGLIIGLVAIVLIGALTILGGENGLGGIFKNITDTLAPVAVDAGDGT